MRPIKIILDGKHTDQDNADEFARDHVRICPVVFGLKNNTSFKFVLIGSDILRSGFQIQYEAQISNSFSSFTIKVEV